MSLGNVPRRNMSAEDRAIQARIKLHTILTAANVRAGMDDDAASKASFAEVVKMTRAQAEAQLRKETA